MNDKKAGLSYRDAGVNIDAATEALRSVKDTITRTFDDRVLKEIGSFGAMYRLDTTGMEAPVLVSSVDGVGTKLKLAFLMKKHDTVGIDLVSHCVNDILVQGARPLFFLDYLACGVLDPRVVAEVIRGLATGCRYAGCALIGGETAEMPSMYQGEEYDLAGTIVGVVDRKNIVDGATVAEGDAILGLKSSGLHTNGYSLARKVCFDLAGLTCADPLPGADRTVGEELLEPHRSYAKVIQLLMRIVEVKAMAHVTGGGITDNLPRSLPPEYGAEINLDAWKIPVIFRFIRETGNIAGLEMLRTFNMGLGYLVVVAQGQADKAVDALRQAGEDPALIGRVVRGKNRVHYTGRLPW